MAANPMVGARVKPEVYKLLEALAEQRNVQLADVVRSALEYLPPGQRYFGCRNCHKLAYASQRLGTPFRLLIPRSTDTPQVGRERSAIR